MSKNVFWPATLIVMGLIFMASNLGLLPSAFWNFWPLLLIIVGLGGLLTADRSEWMWDGKKKAASAAPRKVTKSVKPAKSRR